MPMCVKLTTTLRKRLEINKGRVLLLVLIYFRRCDQRLFLGLIILYIGLSNITNVFPKIN